MSHQNNQKKARNSKRLRILFNSISLLLIIGILIWGVMVYFHLNESNYTDDAQVEEYINPISTRVVGYIKSINFEEHQKVKKGDTILVIDDSEFKIQLAQAQANLKDAQAGKNVVSSDIDLAQNSTSISDANVAEIKAQLDNQAMNLKRYKNLLDNDVISQFQYDEEKTKFDAMSAKYHSLENQRKSTTLNTKTVSQKLFVSDAAIMRAQAAVDMAKLNISYCYILAPYDGVIGRRKIAVGQYLQAGQTLTSIVQSSDKWITANYTESQIDQINPGDKVDIKIDAIPGVHFEGVVEALSAATGSKYSAVPVDNSTGNFIKVQQRIPVKIIFSNINDQKSLAKVRAGMNAQITKK